MGAWGKRTANDFTTGALFLARYRFIQRVITLRFAHIEIPTLRSRAARIQLIRGEIVEQLTFDISWLFFIHESCHVVDTVALSKSMELPGGWAT